MRDYTIPRYFKLKGGLTVEISFMAFVGKWRAVIYQHNDEDRLLPQEWLGTHKTSAVKAIRAARLQRRLYIDPEFRAVYRRLKPNYDDLTIESLRQARDKLLMTDKNTPPKRFYMNSKLAQRVKSQLAIYKDPAIQAGLNLPVIIEDNSLPDGKVLKSDGQK